eukprot:UN26620
MTHYPSLQDQNQAMSMLGIQSADQVGMGAMEAGGIATGNSFDVHYDFTKPKIISRHSLGDTIIRNMYFNPEGKDLLTLDSDDAVTLWKTEDGLAIDKSIKMKQHIYDVTWIPNSEKKHFVCVGADIPVQLWDFDSQERIQNYQARNHVGEYKTGISCCCPFDGNIVAAGFKKRIHVFQLEHPQDAYRIETVNKARQGQKSFLSCMDD